MFVADISPTTVKALLGLVVPIPILLATIATLLFKEPGDDKLLTKVVQAAPDVISSPIIKEQPCVTVLLLPPNIPEPKPLAVLLQPPPIAANCPVALLS